MPSRQRNITTWWNTGARVRAGAIGGVVEEPQCRVGRRPELVAVATPPVDERGRHRGGGQGSPCSTGSDGGDSGEGPPGAGERSGEQPTGEQVAEPGEVQGFGAGALEPAQLGSKGQRGGTGDGDAGERVTGGRDEPCRRAPAADLDGRDGTRVAPGEGSGGRPVPEALLDPLGQGGARAMAHDRARF